MKRSFIARASALALVSASVMVVGNRTTVSGAQDQMPQMGGIHWARDHQPAGPPSGHGRKSPDLTYHGGPVMHGTFVEPIFWGTSWSGNVGDKVSGLQTFYS